MGRTGTVGRRALLTAGAVALAGCTSDAGGERPKAPSAAERAARAEARRRLRSVATAEALRERYDAVLAAHPALSARLGPLRAAAAAHATALGEGGTGAPVTPVDGRTGQTAQTGKTGKNVPAPTPTVSGPSAPPVAADPAVALKELAAAARKTADTHTDALLDAPPEYARLLASVAAAAAVHAYLLTEGGRG
ncbi:MULTISPECIES: hypothetical protein [Streptomyces]|uniref:hypothetical protein n=1 Tax=Streptomyces TaxID=1883 RepID=UPI0013171C26|nr:MULTISPECIES: hypothetical protein [Streptomyces]QGZ51313.1 hypothetical protein GPZ77_25615 [Streptomyces sp. QHH-9511]GGU04846.1 hypothetical protein GCM10010272_57410 [Streptomyces lateritius]